MKCCLLEHRKDYHLKPFQGSLEDFDLLLHRFTGLADKDGPAIVCGTFHEGVHPKWGTFGRWRKKIFVHEMTMLGIDIDKGVTDISAFLALWPFRGYWWTTSGHGVAGAVKFRVLLPFSEPINAEQYSRLWMWANDRCGGTMDPQCKDPTRLFFLPRAANPDSTETPVVEAINPECLYLNPLDFISAEAPPQPPRRALAPRPEVPGTELVSRARAAVTEAAAEIVAAEDDHHNETINKHAFQAGKAMHYAGLDQDEVLAELLDAADALGYTPLSAAEGTILRALDESEISADNFGIVKRAPLSAAMLAFGEGISRTAGPQSSTAPLFYAKHPSYYLVYGGSEDTPLGFKGPGKVVGQCLEDFMPTYIGLGHPFMGEPVPGSKAKPKPLTSQALKCKYGQVVHEISTRFANEAGWAAEQSDDIWHLYYQVAPERFRPISERMLGECQKLAAALFGDRLQDVLSWMSKFRDQTKSLCALLLIGGANCGKGFMARCLSRNYSKPPSTDVGAHTPIPMWEALFNRDQFKEIEIQKRNPIKFVDEHMSGSLDFFKGFMDRHDYSIRNMYSPDVSFYVRPRVVMAVNSLRKVFPASKFADANDIDAVSDRVGAVLIPDSAKYYLASMGMTLLDEIAQGGWCQYMQWLEVNHVDAPDIGSGRFDVCGWDSDAFKSMPAYMPSNDRILQSIIKAVLLKAGGHVSDGVYFGPITAHLKPNVARDAKSTRGMEGIEEVWVTPTVLVTLANREGKDDLSPNELSEPIKMICGVTTSSQITVNGKRARYWRVPTRLMYQQLEDSGHGTEDFRRAIKTGRIKP